MLGIHISEGTADGWFGQGKTSVALSIAVLIVLAAGIAFGIFIAVNTISASQSTVPAAPTAPAPITAGTIQIPDGPKIKVVFNGPPELKASWEKIGMLDSFQIQLIGTLKNVSEQSVKFSEIGFFFDSQQTGYIPGLTLNPGETMKILRAFPYAENAKVLEVKIKDFETIGSSTATPKPTTTEPTATPILKETGFIKTPQDTQSPERLVAAFFFLCDAGQYDKATKLLTEKSFQNFQAKGGLAYLHNRLTNGRQLSRIEIIEVNFQEEKEVDVCVVLYYKNGGNSIELDCEVIKQGSDWKLQ